MKKDQWLMLTTTVSDFEAPRLLQIIDLTTKKQSLYSINICDAFSIKTQLKSVNDLTNIEWQAQNDVKFYLNRQGVLLAKINNQIYLINRGAGFNFYYFNDDYDRDLYQQVRHFFKDQPTLVKISPTKYPLVGVYCDNRLTNPTYLFHFNKIAGAHISHSLIKFFKTSSLVLADGFLTIANFKKPTKWVKPLWLKAYRQRPKDEFNLMIEFTYRGQINIALSEYHNPNNPIDQISFSLVPLKPAKQARPPLVFKSKSRDLITYLKCLYLNNPCFEQPVQFAKISQFDWSAQIVTIESDIISEFERMINQAIKSES